VAEAANASTHGERALPEPLLLAALQAGGAGQNRRASLLGSWAISVRLAERAVGECVAGKATGFEAGCRRASTTRKALRALHGHAVLSGCTILRSVAVVERRRAVQAVGHRCRVARRLIDRVWHAAKDAVVLREHAANARLADVTMFGTAALKSQVCVRTARAARGRPSGAAGLPACRASTGVRVATPATFRRAAPARGAATATTARNSSANRPRGAAGRRARACWVRRSARSPARFCASAGVQVVMRAFAAGACEQRRHAEHPGFRSSAHESKLSALSRRFPGLFAELTSPHEPPGSSAAAGVDRGA